MVTASPDEENKRNRTRDIETNSESRSPVGRRRFLQAAGAGATVALAGCSGGSGDDDVVRLGATYILSGFASLYGEAAERGLEMAQSEINDNGGGIDGRDVEVTVRDTEASADTAIQQMRSLVEEDNVHGLFGLQRLQRRRTGRGAAGGTAPDAVHDHARGNSVRHSPEGEHEDSVGNDYVFRDSNSLSQDIYGAALTAAELDATGGRRSAPTTRSATRRGTTSKTSVRVSVSTPSSPPNSSRRWRRAITRRTSVRSSTPSRTPCSLTPETGGQAYYTPYAVHRSISSIDAEPDAVLTPLWGADLTTFIGQAEDAGWFDQIDHTLFSVGMGTDLASDGNPLPEGEYASTRYDPFVPDTEANNTFRDTYYEEYDALPTYNAEGAYRAVYLYKEAIESAGSTEASARRGVHRDGTRRSGR